MPEKVKVGVIGAGAIALLRHLPAYRACEQAGTAELVAVADPVEENAGRAAEQFAIPHRFADYRDLLQLPLDAVSVCTPNASHEPISLASLDAGKHVLCEKPLALDLSGAWRMHERAERTRLKTMVNFRYRWVPAAAFVRDLVRGGELGELYHLYANYFNGTLYDPTTPIQWRQTRAESGSGVLGDLGSHLIDLARYWVGGFASVQGHLRTFVAERPLTTGGTGHVDVDDACTFQARFDNGAEGVFNASRCAIGRGNHQRIELYGTKGALIYEIEKGDRGGDRLQLCLGDQARQDAFATVDVPPAYLAGTPESPMIDFVDAIRTDRPPTPSFYDGLRCQEVLEAVELSAREGIRVDLPLARGGDRG